MDRLFTTGGVRGYDPEVHIRVVPVGAVGKGTVNDRKPDIVKAIAQ
ncbi:MAG: hypothetical protein NC930_03720 [Candidatus Omnitrophica bacterium]|nr:hypothetical protein [Candidatus Omnitrophota bacterium]